MELEEEHRAMIISSHTRHQASLAQATSDPAFQQYTAALMERFDELWGSPHNPLMRETKDGPPGELERAIITHVVRTTTALFVIDATERDSEPDRARMNRETNVLMHIMAGGYLWRLAERERIPSETPLREAESAAQTTSEHPSEDESERSEKLRRAVWWGIQTLASFTYPPEQEPGSPSGKAAQDTGFQAVADFALETEGLHASQMILGEKEMRLAFKAGLALREIEPLFPPD